MRSKSLLVAALVALATVGATLAGSARAASPKTGIHYAFLGQLTATADGSVSVDVVGGNRAALAAMLGQPVAQTFAYDDSTEFLSWSAGVPTVVPVGSLASGEYVRINVRAAAGASLADIEQAAATLIGDYGTQLAPRTQPVYTFRGTLTAVGDGTVTLDVRGGNGRAMRLLVGQDASQTFTTGDQTIFLLWQGKVPTVIGASQLKVGDRVVVRVAADKGSTLAQVESTAALHVGDREPANAAGTGA